MKAEGWEPNELLASPTYRHPVPFFTAAINGQEIVEALECRMNGLGVSEFFIAVHWSVLREARDEIETLQREKQEAFDLGFRAAGGTIIEHERLRNPFAQGMSAEGENSRSEVEGEARQPGPAKQDASNA